MPPNVFEAAFDYDEADPDGYRAGMARVGELAGGKDLAVRLYQLPAGQSVCPYHYEYEEEWLLVLDGEVSVRGTDGEQHLQRGSLLCFPSGPGGAHKVTHRGGGPAAVLMFSRAAVPAVAVYPDSDKIGVWPGNPSDQVMLRRVDGRVDYWDGEA